MLIAGQPPPSPPLQEAIRLLADGDMATADEVVTRAARAAKARYGSGSHPLSVAYADMGRLHFLIGEYKKAGTEFRHACDSPMPTTLPGRVDRLAFMFGFAACLDALKKPEEAEKVLRQCVAFARNLHGSASPGLAAALEPLARLLLRTGKAAEAAELMDEAYNILWKHGHPTITSAIPTRAESLKAVGRGDDAFADLHNLPDDLVSEAVAGVVVRHSEAGESGERVQKVLVDLLKFVDRRLGDGHPATIDTLAAIVHQEGALGATGNQARRATAARRVLWGYAVRRIPAELLLNLEVGFEPGGEIHLVPHLTREPNPNEAIHLEAVLTQAVDDLYARPAKKSLI